MCDLNKLNGFITAASVAMLAAIALFAIAAINASSFWGAFGNAALMIAAAVLLGTAIASLNLARAEFAKCFNDRCASVGDQLHAALIAAITGATILLAATVAGAFGASIPWVGVAVAAGLVIGGIACTVGLGLVAKNIEDFDRCVRNTGGPALGSSTIAKAFATIAGVATGGFTVVAGFGTGTIPNCTPGGGGKGPCV